MPTKEENLYRSSFAIRKELKPGLLQVLEELKLSLGELLTMMSEDPVRAERTLGTWTAERREARQRVPQARRDTRAKRKEMLDALKRFDADTLAKLLEQLHRPHAAQPDAAPPQDASLIEPDPAACASSTPGTGHEEHQQIEMQTCDQASGQRFHEFFTIRIAEVGLTNSEMAEALGYPRPNVISMIRQGDMKLPLNKIGPAARKLEVDPVFLLQKVLSESAPDLLGALNEVIGDRLVTANEKSLLDLIRNVLHGFDPDLAADDGIVKALMPELQRVRTREAALSAAALRRLSHAS